MKQDTVAEVAQTIESKFKGTLKGMAEDLASRFPMIRTSVSSFINQSGDTHVLSLECLFTEAQASQPDLLALCITTERSDISPTINVDISWGDPSGYVEADLFEEPRRVSSQTFAAIEAGLPSVFAVLDRLIVQGKPSQHEHRTRKPV